MKMEFHVPIGCRNEVFSVAHMGKEWLTRVKSGCREVTMTDAQDVSIGTAEITEIWFGTMSHVPAIFLETYHDPVCRTWSGLQQVLQGISGTPVDEKTEVTLLRLKYTGSAIKIATVKDIPPKSFGGRG